ncbi:MAG: DNA translocase FtsK [Clostridia bacterium]|nr:DNA translocase FtsK [Clostridia bacterium]
MENGVFNRRKKNLSYVGIGILFLCTIVFLSLFTGLIHPIKYFLLGTFGLFSYPLFIIIFMFGMALINKKRYVFPLRYILYITFAIVSLLAIVQNIMVGGFDSGFLEFLGYNYTRQLTPGGIVIGLLISPVKFSLGTAGVYAIFSIFLIVFSCLIADYLVYVRKNAEREIPLKVARKKQEEKEQKRLAKLQSEKRSEWMLDREGNLVGKNGKIFGIDNEERTIAVGQSQDVDDVHANTLSKLEIAISRRENKDKPKITLDAKIEEENSSINSAKKKLGLIKNGVIESSQPREKELTLREKLEKNQLSKKEYLLTPPTLNEITIYPFEQNKQEKRANEDYLAEVNDNVNILKQEKNEIANLKAEENLVEESDYSFVNLEEETSYLDPESKAVAGDLIKKMINDESDLNIKAESLKIQKPENKSFSQIEIPGAEKKSPIEVPKNYYSKPPKYSRPSYDLLNTIEVDNTDLQESIQKKAIVLENALETFNISAKVIRIVVGPAVTRYELEMPVGVPVKKILAHSDDIALNLASNGDIRIEAPIPGRSAVGIEVPNDKISTVGIKEILNSREFNEAKAPLTFALGKDIGGAIRVCNLSKMTHLIVAGATGSGKSVCLNAIITSLIYKNSPEDLRLILIDPKRVEFTMYNGLPHLMLPNVITETDKAINALTWAINEMERRFSLFQESRARNLEEYNICQAVLSGEVQKLPIIVIIIDELADLMMLAKKEIEDKIMRLAQKARAAGIHLILATQRPSVNVITGTIKANFPSRIAFAVTSFVDSKTILDIGGAEKLLGKGDMLFAPNDKPEPTRIQGCYIDGKEVERVVEYIKSNNDYDFDDETAKSITEITKVNGNPFAPDSDAQNDELLPLALRLFIENGQASITMLQRRFRIGFSRAASLVDEMERRGYIGAAEGSKQRSVNITMEEYKNLFGESNE